MQNGPTTIPGTRPNRPAASYAGRSKRWTSNAGRPDSTTHKTRKEAMSGIWRSPVPRSKSAIRSRRRTTTSTPNIISDRCARTRTGRNRICRAGRPRQHMLEISHERETADLPYRDQKQREAAERKLRLENLPELGRPAHSSFTAILCLSHGGAGRRQSIKAATGRYRHAKSDHARAVMREADIDPHRPIDLGL